MIEVNNVYKKYKKFTTSKGRLLDVIFPGKYSEDFFALHDVTFEAEEGEVIGFIGINGSGKSTLSNIIAGVVPETSGSIEVNGEVAIIAVAAGLKNDLSGRDNIELKLLMLGFSKQQIKYLEDEIIEFAELEQFIDQPVKTYSSGMKSRLGFAISVSVDPDILIIDEALSVGDKAFAEKSLQKMNEFKAEGKTMIFVSHSIGQMKEFCDKILWLEFGKVKDYGSVSEIVPRYEKFLDAWKKMTKDERRIYRQDIINNQTIKANELIEAKIKETKTKKSVYREMDTSRLVKLRKQSSYIYSTPTDLKQYKSSKKKQGYVHFSKRRTNDIIGRYYLLSVEPSAQTGVIGWMNQKDLIVRQHVRMDEDKKEFTLKGTGRAYNQVWGDVENIVIDNLEDYKNDIFYVERTDKVGKLLWYYGELREEKVWIRGVNLEEIIR